MKKCQAKRTNGKPCTANAGATGYCFAHDPTLGRKRAQARRNGGKHRGHVENKTPFPDCNLQSAVGLGAFLEAVIRDAWKLETGVQRARTLGYLAQVQKGVLEIGELETRLAALEGALKLRESQA